MSELDTADTERPPAPLLCAACHHTYADDDCDRPMLCDGCKAAICETCEVMRCEQGYHACPLCGARMGGCQPASDDGDVVDDDDDIAVTP